MEEKTLRYYAIRTTSGKELDAALIIENKVLNSRDIDVASIIIPPDFRGYIFIESTNLSYVYKAIADVKYVKSTQPIQSNYEELERIVKPKPIIELLKEGETVEIVRGPFRGMLGRVVSISKSKKTVTLNLLEASFEIPIEVPSDYVKPFKKG
ncbi:MAG: transcription elongation factor Spt5 [Desulfurococcaceae archaeon]